MKGVCTELYKIKPVHSSQEGGEAREPLPLIEKLLTADWLKGKENDFFKAMHPSRLSILNVPVYEQHKLDSVSNIYIMYLS